jgi:hypothetical protein
MLWLVFDFISTEIFNKFLVHTDFFSIDASYIYILGLINFLNTFKNLQ